MNENDLDNKISETMNMQIDTSQIFAKIGNEEYYRKIISNLTFIIKIKTGEKVNVKKYFTRNNNDIYQRIIRTFVNLAGSLFGNNEIGETKNELLEYISDNVNKAFELIHILNAHHQNPLYKKEIISQIICTLEKLLQPDHGIANIIKTYSDDSYFTAQLDAFRITLTSRIKLLYNCKNFTEPIIIDTTNTTTMNTMNTMASINESNIDESLLLNDE